MSTDENMQEAVEYVMAAGNGASRLLRRPGHTDILVSYLWGKLRVDVVPKMAQNSLPGMRGGGSDTKPPSSN